MQFWVEFLQFQYMKSRKRRRCNFKGQDEKDYLLLRSRPSCLALIKYLLNLLLKKYMKNIHGCIWYYWYINLYLALFHKGFWSKKTKQNGLANWLNPWSLEETTNSGLLDYEPIRTLERKVQCKTGGSLDKGRRRLSVEPRYGSTLFCLLIQVTSQPQRVWAKHLGE